MNLDSSIARRSFLLTLAFVCLLVSGASWGAPGVAAQFRRDVGPPELRIKPHEMEYIGVLEIVGEVGGIEQYRVGPDTIVLGVDLAGEGSEMTLEYSLDLGDGQPSGGTVELSELGFNVARHWRPALEMLSLLSIVPLTREPKAKDEAWTEITSYVVPGLDLEFAEATRFTIDDIDDGLVTIMFSAEGGGTRTIDRPQLGAGARMEVSRESAREGTFVFDIEQGRVISSERLERITSTSVVWVGGEAQTGPTEVQTVRLQLVSRSP